MNGEALWQVRLLPEYGLPQVPSSFGSVFSADSSTVYVTLQFAGDMNDFGYLYAIAGQPGSRDAGDAATTRFAPLEEE